MKTAAKVGSPELAPVIRRLSAIATLGPADIDRLQAAVDKPHVQPARREFVTEGEALHHPRIMLSGWACRTHLLHDGRRQVLSFLLPGDLLNMCNYPNPVAEASVLALTEVVTCPAPMPAMEDTSLAAAYAASAAMGEHYLLRQITRLGRFNAYERVADWLMEIRERQTLAGIADGNRFQMPLTQEVIADALGLTSVHMNRTIQALRSDGLLELRGGYASLPDIPRLEALIEHRSARAARPSGARS